MTREKIGAALVGSVAVLLVSTWAFQLYTTPDPWKLYVLAVRNYMLVGSRADSSSLARHSAADQPLLWVLDAAERQPKMVAGWAQQLRSGMGQRRGDTVVLGLWANDVDGCSHLNTVSALFLDDSAAPQMLALSSPCIDQLPPAGLSW